MTTVGAFHAKTHFSEILKKVREGETFKITYRGEEVAKIAPAQERFHLDRKLTREDLAQFKFNGGGNLSKNIDDIYNF